MTSPTREELAAELAETRTALAAAHEALAAREAVAYPAPVLPHEQLKWQEQWHLDQLRKIEDQRVAFVQSTTGDPMRHIEYVKLRLDAYYHQVAWLHTQIDRRAKELAGAKYQRACDEYGRASKTIFELRQFVEGVRAWTNSTMPLGPDSDAVRIGWNKARGAVRRILEDAPAEFPGMVANAEELDLLPDLAIVALGANCPVRVAIQRDDSDHEWYVTGDSSPVEITEDAFPAAIVWLPKEN